MGLNPGDIEKVPDTMGPKDCYRRIYEWHKKNGVTRLKEKYGREDGYSRTYLDLLHALPPANAAGKADMDFVFGEVISMLMEWSYHEEDDHGIKMAAYAHSALDQQYPTGFHDEAFRRSREASKLCSEFDYPKWKEKYKE